MRSVRTSHAFSFQDMWKWNSARSSTSRKAGYAPGSKIIEKLIFNQLFEYLIDSDLLADWQNGLRPVHSTLWPPCLEATSSENVKKAIGLISKTRGGRKGLRWCGFALFLVRFCGNSYFNSRYCGFKTLSGLRLLQPLSRGFRWQKCLRW